MSVLTTKILPENDFYIAYNVVGISLFDSLTVLFAVEINISTRNLAFV